MASSHQTGRDTRNMHSSRPNRPSQRLLTLNDVSSPNNFLGRKRMIVKQEDADSPIVSKVKHEELRRSAMPSQRARESCGIPFDKPTSSSFVPERSYEYGLEEEEHYEEYYDQLPPRLSNTSKNNSPVKPKKIRVPIVSMGKTVVTGRKDNLAYEIDMQYLIDKYVNAESHKETEAWLINIGLCERLNSVTREMDRMKGEMSEMWEYFHHQFTAKDGIKDKLTMQTPWPGGTGVGSSSIMPTPFGANPSPEPSNEGDFIVPPIYAQNGIDCREIYNEMQRKGKKRPGVVFLTHFVRDLCAVAIEPPHKYLLTIRSKNRKDQLVNISPNFMKPIETFFLKTCDVTSGLTYALGDMLREALANELRELRRAPRKEKITLNKRMMDVLRDFRARPVHLFEEEEEEGSHGEGRDEIVGERREDSEELEEEVEI